MAISSDEVLIQAIGHTIRREILQLLHDAPKSFTDLLNHFDIATSKLNYHLKLLEGFIEKDSEGKYTLTPLGHRANNIMALIQREMLSVDQNDQSFVKNAYIAQKKTNGNFIVNLLDIGIVGIGMVIIFWIIMLIASIITHSFPIYFYFILGGIIIAFLFFLRHLIITRKSASGFIQRIEDHLANGSAH